MNESASTSGNHAKKQPRTVKKALIPVVVIVMMAAGALFMIRTAFERGSQDSFRMSEGKPVPDFVLQKLGGGEVKFSSIGKKILILNFWATWCESCMLEMPSLVELRESFKDQGLEVLGINVDENPESVVPPVLREMGIKFPVFVDANGKLGELFDVSALPTTVVIDGQRKVLFVETGERDWNSAKVREQIERWLKG